MKSFSSSPHILLVKSMSMFTSSLSGWRAGGCRGSSGWLSRRSDWRWRWWWWWLQEQNWLQPQFFWQKVCMREAGNLIAVLEQSPGETEFSPHFSSQLSPRLSRLVISLFNPLRQTRMTGQKSQFAGVLISEYFQHHKWISSVLPSLVPSKNTLKASKFCIEIRGARLDKKPWYEWHCHYKMFVYWWLSH